MRTGAVSIVWLIGVLSTISAAQTTAPATQPAVGEHEPTYLDALQYYENLQKSTVTVSDLSDVRQYGPLLTKYKQYDKAIDLYERALAAVPEDAKLFQLLGRAQAAKGSVDQAITSYESAIRLNDKAADVHID